MAKECTVCGAAFVSHGPTHVLCPDHNGRPLPGSEDLLELAERTLYPGVRYQDMTKPQRDACIGWARTEAMTRGLWPMKRYKERAA